MLRVSLFVSSSLATGLPGSPDVAVACTFLEEDAVGSSGTDGCTKKKSWHATQVPCVRLRARIRAKLSK